MADEWESVVRWRLGYDQPCRLALGLFLRSSKSSLSASSSFFCLFDAALWFGLVPSPFL